MITSSEWLRVRSWDCRELLRREGRAAEREAEHQVRVWDGDGQEWGDCVQGGGERAGVWQCEVQAGLSQLSPGGDRREGQLPWSPLRDLRPEAKVSIQSQRWQVEEWRDTYLRSPYGYFWLLSSLFLSLSVEILPVTKHFTTFITFQLDTTLLNFDMRLI